MRLWIFAPKLAHVEAHFFKTFWLFLTFQYGWKTHFRRVQKHCQMVKSAIGQPQIDSVSFANKNQFEDCFWLMVEILRRSFPHYTFPLLIFMRAFEEVVASSRDRGGEKGECPDPATPHNTLVEDSRNVFSDFQSIRPNNLYLTWKISFRYLFPFLYFREKNH